jgi:hypothetical protein
VARFYDFLQKSREEDLSSESPLIQDVPLLEEWRQKRGVRRHSRAMANRRFGMAIAGIMVILETRTLLLTFIWKKPPDCLPQLPFR